MMTRKNRTLARSLATAVAALGMVTLAAAPAVHAAPGSATAASFTSIFAEQGPGFDGTGWELCDAPVTWTVDVSTLAPKAARTRIADLEWALGQWSKVSGLTFQYAGHDTFRLDEENGTLRSTTEAKTRHVSFAFMADKSTTLLDKTRVGQGSPLAEKVTSGDGTSTVSIVQGSAIFSVDFLADASRKDARALLLHEIGHVLGLGHTGDESQVMHQFLDGNTTLGAGDIAGVKAVTQPCQT